MNAIARQDNSADAAPARMSGKLLGVQKQRRLLQDNKGKADPMQLEFNDPAYIISRLDKMKHALTVGKCVNQKRLQSKMGAQLEQSKLLHNEMLASHMIKLY